MSHQIHSKKPSLPSIHFLLNESISKSPPPQYSTSSTTSSSLTNVLSSATTTISQQQQQQQQLPIHHHHVNTDINNTTTITTTSISSNNLKRQHSRQSASISSLPSELQQLYLSAPAFNYDTIIPPPADRSENHQPSWMMMPPTTTTESPPPPPPPPVINHKRPPGASHSRSISDFSLVHNLPPVPPINSRQHRYQTHRRSVSANTTPSSPSDFFKMIYNPTSTTTPILPYIEEQQHYMRAHTDSPPPPPNDEQQLFDALNINKRQPTVYLSQVQEEECDSSKRKNKQLITTSVEKEEIEQYENVIVARDEQTGRYYCPFCNKAFNRPSSLRIHTYSHTGEKPFKCEIEGCGRQFSVQSNMRRHLRVHRLGRSKK